MTGWPRLDMPAFGQPCNSCGLCCLREQCPLSLAVLGEHPVCPALRQHGDELRCGMMTDAATYMGLPDWGNDLMSHAVRLILGSGQGCDAGVGEPDDDHIRDLNERVHQAIAEAPDEVRAIVFALIGKEE